MELDRTIDAVRRPLRWDYTDSEILKLAQAMRATVLETSGDTAGAAAAARFLAPELDPRLLSGILVHEVLDRISG